MKTFSVAVAWLTSSLCFSAFAQYYDPRVGFYGSPSIYVQPVGPQFVSQPFIGNPYFRSEPELYATPVEAFAAPYDSFARALVEYATPIASYATPVASYATPVQLAAPVASYAISPMGTPIQIMYDEEQDMVNPLVKRRSNHNDPVCKFIQLKWKLSPEIVT